MTGENITRAIASIAYGQEVLKMYKAMVTGRFIALTVFDLILLIVMYA